MKYIKQLGIILLLLFIGEAVSRASNIPVPGNIIGMVLMTLCLRFGLIRVESVREVSMFFLTNIAFFFIAPGVVLLESFKVLQGQLLKVIIMITLSTFIVMIVTAVTVSLVQKMIGRKVQ